MAAHERSPCVPIGKGLAIGGDDPVPLFQTRAFGRATGFYLANDGRSVGGGRDDADGMEESIFRDVIQKGAGEIQEELFVDAVSPSHHEGDGVLHQGLGGDGLYCGFPTGRTHVVYRKDGIVGQEVGSGRDGVGNYLHDGWLYSIDAHDEHHPIGENGKYDIEDRARRNDGYPHRQRLPVEGAWQFFFGYFAFPFVEHLDVAAKGEGADDVFGVIGTEPAFP